MKIINFVFSAIILPVKLVKTISNPLFLKILDQPQVDDDQKNHTIGPGGGD